ncbi:MAG: hypothetical protein AAFR54_11215 [Planctomycetota bacterium]
MTVQRRAIRDATKVVLVAAATGLGESVFENRVDPFRHRDLPAASIFTRAEQVSTFSEDPRGYIRDLELVVQLVVDGDGDVDDAIDELADEVERAIELGDLIETVPELADVTLERVEGPLLADEGRRAVAMLQLVYQARYAREFAVDADELTPFTGGTLSIDSHRPREGAEAESTFDVPTT